MDSSSICLLVNDDGMIHMEMQKYNKTWLAFVQKTPWKDNKSNLKVAKIPKRLVENLGRCHEFQSNPDMWTMFTLLVSSYLKNQRVTKSHQLQETRLVLSVPPRIKDWITAWRSDVLLTFCSDLQTLRVLKLIMSNFRTSLALFVGRTVLPTTRSTSN